MSRLAKLICSAAVFITASSSVFADHEITQSGQTKPMPSAQSQLFEQGLGLPPNKYPAAYSAPACISLNGGWDFDIFASFIYWHASQANMDVAYVPLTATASSSTTIPGAVAYQNFQYEPGFKTGLGFNTNYDGWICWAEYTWLHQTISNSQTAPLLPSGLAGSWTANDWFTYATATSPPVHNSGVSVNSSWKMKFDMLDVVFSRPFYEGTQLTTSPYAGMRALWLRQNLNITMVQTNSVNNATSSNRSKCWSLGPVAGVMGHWMLGSGFRFEGNTAMSVLYTRYTKIVHNEQASQALTPGVLTDGGSVRKVNALRPTAQIGVGLGWGSYFAKNECYFDLSARYDFNYFWNQNVMRRFVGQLQGSANPEGDLQMHGLTATARFDF